ncbi:MAG TPA: UbiA-like polyprenyltransferase [Polyangia bacterium]
MSTSTVPPSDMPPQRTHANPVLTFGRMVKFSHTIFALPFALAAAALAARGVGLPLSRLLGIIVAMAGARTTAMGFNRIIDRRYDAQNPRTAGREIPRGAVSLSAAWALTAASAALFIAAAAYLGPLCLELSPVALLFLYGYSLTKRFTALCHLVLGVAIASGPAGAWIAVRGNFGVVPGLLMLAVASWIGGFDVLYALADRDFDRAVGLHSIPARLGVSGALLVSGLLHVLALGALVALAPAAGLGIFYLAGVVLVGALLVWEHAIVRPNDLSRLNMAFFNLNGYVSMAFLAAVVADIALGR